MYSDILLLQEKSIQSYPFCLFLLFLVFFMIRSRVYQHKPRKRGRYIFMAIGALFLIMIIMPGQAIQPPERIVIQKGDTLQDFFTPLSQSQKVRMKRYLRTHPVAASDKTLAQGTYLFS